MFLTYFCEVICFTVVNGSVRWNAFVILGRLVLCLTGTFAECLLGTFVMQERENSKIVEQKSCIFLCVFNKCLNFSENDFFTNIYLVKSNFVQENCLNLIKFKALTYILKVKIKLIKNNLHIFLNF